VLGIDAAGAIGFSYERHGRLSEDAPHTRGKVLQIKAAHSRYAPAPGGNGGTLYPVAPGHGNWALSKAPMGGTRRTQTCISTDMSSTWT
jgi:hypothetical protein